MSTQENIGYKSGELAGQAQMKKDEVVGQVSDACNSASQSLQETKTPSSGGFLEETGDLVMNMAQSAADALAKTLGDSSNNNGSSSSNN